MIGMIIVGGCFLIGARAYNCDWKRAWQIAIFAGVCVVAMQFVDAGYQTRKTHLTLEANQ